MKNKIDKLKQIILKNDELSKYYDEIQDNLSESQLITIIEKILTELEKYNNKSKRPVFYTELQTFLSVYSEDNQYKKQQQNSSQQQN